MAEAPPLPRVTRAELTESLPIPRAPGAKMTASTPMLRVLLMAADFVESWPVPSVPGAEPPGTRRTCALILDTYTCTGKADTLILDIYIYIGNKIAYQGMCVCSAACKNSDSCSALFGTAVRKSPDCQYPVLGTQSPTCYCSTSHFGGTSPKGTRSCND